MTTHPSWLIDDHTFREADPGDTYFDPERGPNEDQPCGNCGDDWCWHATDTETAA